MNERDAVGWGFYKALKLLTAEEISGVYSLPTESPVFVSPYVNDGIECMRVDCNTVYSPLIYQVPKITRAQHFHEDFYNGGIYLGCYNIDYAVLPRGSWIARVKPLGRISSLRAEAVWLEEIVGVCLLHENERLLEGELVISELYRGMLFPYCGMGELANPVWKAKNTQVMFTSKVGYFGFHLR